jgi:transcriptional regulator with XRE-family HTH domain
MNQSELARRAGYSRSMICMLLNGTKRPSLSGAFRLESVTGIPARLWAHGTPRQLKREVKKWIGLEAT